MKKYLPMKIHSVYYGYCWWWGKKIFCKGGYIVPMSEHYPKCQTLYGKAIEPAYPESWHKSNLKYRVYGKNWNTKHE